MTEERELESVRSILGRGEPATEFQRRRKGSWFHDMKDSEVKERIDELRENIRELGPIVITRQKDFEALFGYVGDAKFHSLVSYVHSRRKEWGLDFSETIVEGETIAVAIGLLR